jgi:hypothetical protein
MDLRINRVDSRVHATDSEALMDPRIMSEIVRVCVAAVKRELQRDERIAKESRLSSGVSSDR